jgi:hypothetical protein
LHSASIFARDNFPQFGVATFDFIRQKPQPIGKGVNVFGSVVAATIAHLSSNDKNERSFRAVTKGQGARGGIIFSESDHRFSISVEFEIVAHADCANDLTARRATDKQDATTAFVIDAHGRIEVAFAFRF